MVAGFKADLLPMYQGFMFTVFVYHGGCVVSGAVA